MSLRQRSVKPAGILATLVLALFLFSAAPAEAQVSGTVDVQIDFPSLLIFYYYDTLNVSVPSTALASLMTGGVDEFIETTGTITTGFDGVTGFLDANAAISPTVLDTDPAAATLALRRTWAVRSVALAGANTTVTVTPGTSQTLTGNNGGTIAIDAVRTRLSTDTTGSGAGSVSWTPAGLGNVVFGDLIFDLDLSNAGSSGTYSNIGGSQLTITASNP